MDASKITQLMQKQNSKYIHRVQTVDSSTLIWQNQIQSSKYIEKTPDCSGKANCANFPTQGCCSDGNGISNYGGQGKNATIMTGSPQQYPNPYQGSKGSGAFVYSSDVIALQKAGKQACVKGPNATYTELPLCYCTNTNGPTPQTPEVPVNNNTTNPYLPPFDTYNAMKMKYCGPCVEPPHFVKKCGKCTLEPDTKLEMAPCTCAQSLSGYVSEATTNVDNYYIDKLQYEEALKKPIAAKNADSTLYEEALKQHAAQHQQDAYKKIGPKEFL